MADDCRTCLNFIEKCGGDMEWVKTKSVEELNMLRAKYRTFKCPDCGSEVKMICIIQPK